MAHLPHLNSMRDAGSGSDSIIRIFGIRENDRAVFGAGEMNYAREVLGFRIAPYVDWIIAPDAKRQPKMLSGERDSLRMIPRNYIVDASASQPA